MNILWWLAPPVVATLLAMLWVGWLGREGRGEVDREVLVRRLGEAMSKPAADRRTTPTGTPRVPAADERSTGVAVRPSSLVAPRPSSATPKRPPGSTRRAS